jgi:hypothetical protein
MNYLSRLIATIVIWSAFVAVAIASAASGVNDLTAIIGILGAAAMFSTIGVWARSEPGAVSDRSPVSSAMRHSRIEKAKRGDLSRIERLADVLDEGEALALMHELQNRMRVEDDGEMVMLEDLLHEREARRGQ